MFNETLRIERIARTQGGRYYCKAENGVGVPAIKSIRVDVQCELAPLLSILASPCNTSHTPHPSSILAQGGPQRLRLGRRSGSGVPWRTDTSVEEDSRDFPSSMLEREVAAASPTCTALRHSHIPICNPISTSQHPCKVSREGRTGWIIPIPQMKKLRYQGLKTCSQA